MIQQTWVHSLRSNAEAYFFDCLSRSELATKFFSKETFEFGIFKFVTAVEVPDQVDLYLPIGRDSCREWLFHEVESFLQNHSPSLVIFEDAITHASDPFFATHEHPPAWIYYDRVLWPVIRSGSEFEAAQTAAAWSADMRTTVFFTSADIDSSSASSDRVVSTALLADVAASTRHIVIDAFDGEGFLVWSRRIEQN